MTLLTMKNKALLSFVLILVLGSFSCCSFQYDYDDHGLFDWGTDALGTRFVIDTISIVDPRICIYGNGLYILPNRCLDSFVIHPQPNEIAKVFRVLPHNVRSDLFDAIPSNHSKFTERAMEHLSMGKNGYGLYNPSSFTEMTYFEKALQDVEVYKFKTQPDKYVLELFWYDAKRYIDNPYGPNFFAIVSENSEPPCYSSKMDSLERCPIYPNEAEQPHYVLTVEPLFARDIINRHIEEEEGFVRFGPFVRRPWQFSKSFAKKYAFPDL